MSSLRQFSLFSRLQASCFICFTSEIMKEIRLKIGFFTPVFNVFKIAGGLFCLFHF